VELSVTAVYTAAEGGAPSIDVQQIRARLLTI
jgi:hypothetical protein